MIFLAPSALPLCRHERVHIEKENCEVVSSPSSAFDRAHNNNNEKMSFLSHANDQTPAQKSLFFFFGIHGFMSSDMRYSMFLRVIEFEARQRCKLNHAQN